MILMTVALAAILVMVAVVVDLGQLRADRRENQKASDVAALAAGYYMSGKASGSGAAIANPRAACHAALNSVKTNVSGFPSAATLNCDSLPVNATVCENWSGGPMPMVTLTSSGSSPFVMTLKYPVPASELADSRFAGPGAADGTDQCARMLVDLRSSRDTFFAGIVGVGDQTIHARSVVKSNLEITSKNVAALLLLQRTGCQSLNAGGQGQVIVESPSNLNPGRVQADSDGKGTCTTNTNESGYVVYAAGTGNSRIEVQPTADGKPGIIGIFSLTPGVDGRGGAVHTSTTATNGLSVAPVAGTISSRAPVDERYNPPTRTAVTDLHARAWSAVQPATPPSVAHTAVSGAACTAPPATIPGSVVYVDCPDFVVTGSVSFAEAARIYFTGKVTVTGTLAMPVAERIYIRGCRGASTNCGSNATNNAQAYALSVSGNTSQLIVNTPAVAACPATTPPPAPGELTHRITEIATLGGPIIVSGQSNVAMCQTFMYVGRGASSYAALQVTSGPPNCTVELPCPAPLGSGVAWVDEGYIKVSGGGSGSVFWSAPNRSTEAPTTTNPFEDLALWGEGPRLSSLKGTGVSRVSGVYFLPNSPIEFLGQGDQAVPLNAQFIATSLRVEGQGQLRLKPNPNDAVATPSPGGYSLIR